VIHYALLCDKSHKFDGWFANAAAYDAQKSRGLITCPICLTSAVDKALMAPSIKSSAAEKVSLSIGHPQHSQLRDAMLALRNKVTSEADFTFSSTEPMQVIDWIFVPRPWQLVSRQVYPLDLSDHRPVVGIVRMTGKNAGPTGLAPVDP
jgi:hypothetical protein